MSPNPKNTAPTLGDPDRTPFVRFDSGTAIYPANNIYQCTETLLLAIESQSLDDAFSKLIEHGQIAYSYGVTLAATWYALLNSFIRFNGAKATGIADAEARCIAALKIMQQRPAEKAWAELRAFMIANVDDLSGWNGSFRKDIAERSRVYRGEDGNYYYRDDEYGLVMVVNGQTTSEARLDFITSQLVYSSGFLHQFLALFSIFALADDYDRHPAQFHKWVKAVLPDPEYHWVGFNWNFMHFDYSRSYVWRPPSNLADTRWLVGDVLGTLTDTLEIDHWRKHHDPSELDHQWLADGLKYQADYVLETAVHIGSGQLAYIPFENKIFRWINGTAERDATISVSVEKAQQHIEEDEKLNRLLTLLTWDTHHPIRKSWGVVGGRTTYSKALGTRRAAGLGVELGFLLPKLKNPYSEAQWLALAMYREGQNSTSKFYEFLCYWKVVDRVFPKAKQKKDWLEQIAVPKLRHLDRMKDLTARVPDLEEYLRDEQLNAIKHITRPFPLSPDKPAALLEITKDATLMEELARLVMREELKL